MRLIDADLLIKEMSKWYWDKEKQKVAEDDVSPMDLFTHLAITTVQKQPTAFDLDEVVERLEEGKKRAFELCLAINDSAQRLKYIEKEQTIDLAIEIIKGGGVE